jgi:hypothetical protein
MTSRKLKIEQHEPYYKPGVNSGAQEEWAVPAPRVAPIVLLFFTYPMISHEWGKDRIVITTNGEYPWSFETDIFRNG